MNSIRALNVRSRIEENPGRYLNTEPDIHAASFGIAPVKPAAKPTAEEPADTRRSKAASTP
jgi:hypothetical protein